MTNPCYGWSFGSRTFDPARTGEKQIDQASKRSLFATLAGIYPVTSPALNQWIVPVYIRNKNITLDFSEFYA